MYQTTLIIILFRFFLIAFIIGTILILVKSIKNYKTAQNFGESLSLNSSQGNVENAARVRFRVLLKSIIVFVLWVIFSLYLFAIDLAASVGNRVGDEPLVTADSRMLGIMGAHILWLLAGILLIYWLGKMPEATKLQ